MCECTEYGLSQKIEDFSREEKSLSLVQNKKGCAGKEIQEVHEEWEEEICLNPKEGAIYFVPWWNC